MFSRRPAALFLPLLLLLTLPLLSQSPTPENSLPALPEFLPRLSASVQNYFSDLRSITALQKITAQELKPDLSPRGKSKVFEYQFFLLFNRPAGASIAAADEIVERRELLRVDGKANTTLLPFVCPGCETVFSSTLLFLLPAERSAFDFSGPTRESLDGRPALVVSFSPRNPKPPIVRWNAQYFHVEVTSAGRVWVDPESLDVLQLQWKLSEPFSFYPPSNIRARRRGAYSYEVRDVTIRFARIPFKNPDQLLLLPVSGETLDVFEGARYPRLRSTHTFSEFQRFSSSHRIVDAK